MTHDSTMADRRHVLRYEPPGGRWECSCGLNGDSTEQVVPMHREVSRIGANLYARRKASSNAPRKSGQ
jgi:hypothetical protein